MTEPTPLVRYSLDDGIALLQIDDGKANALSPTLLGAINEGLDRAVKEEAKAIVLAGREGRFSAGFDLSVMGQGRDKAMGMVSAGASLALRLLESSVPVLLAVTGHALAMGGVLLLSADERIGADGPFKIGLNEVAIGMTLPEFALLLARDRLSPRHLYRATSAAEIYSPADAVEAGYLDRVVAPSAVLDETLARARQLAGSLDARAHHGTKRALRAELVRQLRASIASNLASQ